MKVYDMKRCTKCGVVKEVSEFGINNTRYDGLQTMCKICKREYGKQHYLRNKEVYIKRAKIRTTEMRTWYKNYKSNLVCEECGFDNPVALQFHHINPKDKEFTISSNIINRSRDEILQEINKCKVLCANCHLIHHSNKELHYE